MAITKTDGVTIPRQRQPRITFKSVPERVIDRIVEMIAHGELAPGMRLATEADFARQLGVSIVALREATSVLKTLGVLGSAPRRGTVVLAGAAYAQFEQLGILLALSEQSTANVVDARAIVEGRAVRLAALRATPGEAIELKEMLQRQDAVMDDSDRFPQEDEAFHRATVAAAHNPILVTVIDSMRYPLRVFRHQTATLQGQFHKAITDHARLVDAIIAGDPEAAERALLEHLEHSAADVRSRLKASTDA